MWGLDDAGERAGDKASDGGEAEESGGIDAHHAAAHMVGGQVLEKRVDGGHGDDHAVSGHGQQKSREIKIAREGEGDDGGKEPGQSADHEKPAAADMRDGSNGKSAQERACSGAGHEDAEAGLSGAQDVTGEISNKGEIRNGQQAADGDQQNERGHLRVAEDISEALLHLFPQMYFLRRAGLRLPVTEARKRDEHGKKAQAVQKEIAALADQGHGESAERRPDDARHIELRGIERDAVGEVFTRQELRHQRLVAGRVE